MIQTVLGILLILLHIVCCVLVWMGIKTHFLKVKKYLIGLVVFVPFWGTICVLLLHLQRLTKRDNRIEPGVEKLRVNEEIYKNIFQAASDMDEKIVPLEEALLINKPGIRRELIMDVLNDDPEEYMDILKQARMNEDVEVVHYAITQLWLSSLRSMTSGCRNWKNCMRHLRMIPKFWISIVILWKNI